MEKDDIVVVGKGPYKGKKGVLLKRSYGMRRGWLVAVDGERGPILVLDSEIKK